MTTRGSSDAGAFDYNRVDEYSRDSYSDGGDSYFTSAAANSSASSRSAGSSSQREDESYYFSTSLPPPSHLPPEPTVFEKKLPKHRDQSSSNANGDDDTSSDTTQGIQTLTRSSAKKKKPQINIGSTEDTATTNCLGFQMELRACLDANDNRESVCMWHFRMWQKCKTEQQECIPNTRFEAFSL